MKKYFQYIHYVLRHKWFVMLACFGEGMIWRGIMHDMSKFRPSEFIPYTKFFYGNKVNPRDSKGYYKPVDTGNIPFEIAWTSHLHRNRHHWQWWVRCNDDGNLAILDMPETYIDEMLCDWVGAGRAQKSTTSVSEWYELNKHKMQLSDTTRKIVEFKLWILPKYNLKRDR